MFFRPTISIFVMLMFSSFCRADATLAALAAATDPCASAALDRAAIEARSGHYSPGAIFSFASFRSAPFKNVAPGANQSYLIGFKSNIAAEKDLIFTVSVYCQQGGWANVVGIAAD